MGCWNETDALTKLPILEGDEIVLFVLGSAPERFFTADRYLREESWQPIGLPFYGTYDDYGSIDLDPEKVDYHNGVLKGFEGSATAETPADLLESISHGKIGSTWHGGVYSTMSVRREGWEAMLEVVANRRARYGSPMTYREHIEDILDRYSDLKKGTDPYSAESFVKGQMIIDDLFISGFWHPLSHYFTDGINAENKENVVRLILTNRLLSSLRLGWTPQFGGGSQDMELELTEMLANVALKDIETMKKRYDDEDEYDEESEA